MTGKKGASGAFRAIKHLFTKPATTKYPYVKPQLGESYRGEPIFDYDKCIGCSLCERNCPSKAIDMVEVDGKKRPQFRLDKCIFCNNCIDVCPKDAIKKSTTFEYATLNKEDLTKKPPAAKNEEKVNQLCRIR
jgi:formate hydrogenlyase subunit 6/NADH:ubiquinone oxidoreductase subunit I